VSVTAAQGFVAAGCHAGVKRRRYDMALVATDDRRPVAAAAVFTQNKFFAPPVAASRERLAASGGRAAAIIVNSGNANAGTGHRGARDAEAMCAATAEALGCGRSTRAGLLHRHHRHAAADGEDPRPLRPSWRRGSPWKAGGMRRRASSPRHKEQGGAGRGSTFTLGGMAKGCGMIAPNMATMLAFLTTDADVCAGEMTPAILSATPATGTFNTLNVDGATSTNDTVILLASPGGAVPTSAEFADAVHKVCEDLTLQMARDAEGMTKMVALSVTGAASDAEARTAAKAIAENNLVKCSWYGGDPYWGRLLAAAGSCGIAFEAEKTSVAYGGILVSRAGTSEEHDSDAVHAHMAKERIEIEVALGLGSGRAQVIGIDLGPGYIKENSVTS
jgi:glutamate N-acetyltransferase/amino-acid N-acetyltransferase